MVKRSPFVFRNTNPYSNGLTRLIHCDAKRSSRYPDFCSESLPSFSLSLPLSACVCVSDVLSLEICERPRRRTVSAGSYALFLFCIFYFVFWLWFFPPSLEICFWLLEVKLFLVCSQRRLEVLEDDLGVGGVVMDLLAFVCKWFLLCCVFGCILYGFLFCFCFVVVVCGGTFCRFANVGALLKLDTFVKKIAISHWGAAEVEEEMTLRNAGPEIVGHFSRLDQMLMARAGMAINSADNIAIMLPRVQRKYPSKSLHCQQTYSRIRFWFEWSLLSLETRSMAHIPPVLVASPSLISILRYTLSWNNQIWMETLCMASQFLF